MQYETLPTETSDRIDEKLKRAGEAWRAGDAKAAEAFRLEAWKMIPEPRYKWDYYPQIISRNFVTRYRDSGEFQKAKEWLKIVRQAYEPTTEDSEDSIGLLEGTVFYEAGEHDKAYALFDKLYKKYRTKFFQEENKKYLDFYLSRRK